MTWSLIGQLDKNVKQKQSTNLAKALKIAQHPRIFCTNIENVHFLLMAWFNTAFSKQCANNRGRVYMCASVKEREISSSNTISAGAFTGTRG